MSIVIFLLVLGSFIFVWIRHVQNYWQKRGVPSMTVPFSTLFFGHREPIVVTGDRVYHIFKSAGARFVGIPSFIQPLALVIDLELVRQVLSNDFRIFSDPWLYQKPDEDPLSCSLTKSRGEEWKRLRGKLTLTFTAAKMSYMCGTLMQVADRLVEVIAEKTQTQSAVLEMQDICSRYTTDVIGLVALGTRCDSLMQPNAKFFIMGNKPLACWIPLLKFIGNKYPRLCRLMRFKPFTRVLIEFYTTIVTDIIELRERKKIRRQDFIDILIELKNQPDLAEELKLTNKEIVAQSINFFISGFETSSATMSACLFQLSQHPDVQQRAREEVLQCLKRYGNQMTYECMKDLKYLEQVVMETLRIYPPVPFIRRIARKNFQVPGSKAVFKVGDIVSTPVYSIHHDPEYYPDPDIFDPERFTPEAIQARHPMTWLGFGAGPCSCIAEQFGRMQVLIGLAMILRLFRLSSAPETPLKLEYDHRELRFFQAKGGIRLKVEKIEE